MTKPIPTLNPTDFGPPVGSLIRSRRGELGLSLSQLAEAVGCAKSYLSEVENGKRNPGDETLVKLEASLKMGSGKLVGAARWQRSLEVGGADVREEVARLQNDQAIARRLASLIARKPAEGKSPSTRRTSRANSSVL